MQSGFRAVCIRCGAKKPDPLDRCAVCGFKPDTDEDWARSLLLSTSYFLHGENKGKTVGELEVIRTRISAGEPVSFDPAEIRALIEQDRDVQATPARRVLAWYLLWIAPVLVVAIAILVLWFNPLGR